MESTTTLLIALSCALGAISFFVIMRRTMRASSTPEWFAHAVVATALALLLTGAFAGSLVFVGYALLAFVPFGVAFLATFAIHLAIFAGCNYILPADEAVAEQPKPQITDQTVGASA